MNPTVEITYQSSDNAIFKVTLYELREMIGIEYGLSAEVENFSPGYSPLDGVTILEIRINEIITFQKSTPATLERIAKAVKVISEIEKHLSENPNSLVAGVFQQLLKQSEQK